MAGTDEARRGAVFSNYSKFGPRRPRIGKELAPSCRSRFFRSKSVAGIRGLAKRALHDAVFNRVKGDHRDPAAGRKPRDRGCEPLSECIELVVDGDTERLKGLCRRVNLTAPVPRRRTLRNRVDEIFSGEDA